MKTSSIAAVIVCAAFISMAGHLGAQTPAGDAAAGVPTFSKDVAPILYANCTSCHRAGEIGPMQLITYKETRPWARSIAQRVAAGTMPPWHADPAHGEFVNDRRLRDAERKTILDWANGGAPEGNPADLSAPPTFAEGWQIQPDIVFAMQEDYPVPASGTIDYKYFGVPTNFAEDKYVSAYEIRPGDRSVVHHVIVFAQTPRPAGAPPAPRREPAFTFRSGMQTPPEHEDKEKRTNDRPAPRALLRGSYLASFAPGQAVRVLAEGTAMRIPAGATLVFQLHYTATGKVTSDRSRIGLVFAKEKPRQEVTVATLQNGNFTLPAGEPNVMVDAEMTLNRDATIWSMLPHTHVRGKRWEYVATYPDGRTETILSVPKYDFNWQTDYVFTQPLKLPKGTKVRSTAWYDNSPANKSNPNPSIDVHWGDQTWEEMQFTAISLTVDRSPDTTTTTASR
jgi:mono/diheme cytochrome c family protein